MKQSLLMRTTEQHAQKKQASSRTWTDRCKHERNTGNRIFAWEIDEINQQANETQVKKKYWTRYLMHGGRRQINSCFVIISPPSFCLRLGNPHRWSRSVSPVTYARRPTPRRQSLNQLWFHFSLKLCDSLIWHLLVARATDGTPAFNTSRSLHYWYFNGSFSTYFPHAYTWI